MLDLLPSLGGTAIALTGMDDLSASPTQPFASMTARASGASHTECPEGEEHVDMAYEHDDEEADIMFERYEGIDWSSKYWGSTRDIALELLTALVDRHSTAIHGNAHPGSCSLLRRRNGVYNTVYILEFENGTKVCVRVPACGWSERWNEKDAKLLRCTALTMKHIGEKTELPLPKILAYDTSLDNEIRAPYLLMSYLEGYSAREAWSSNDWQTPKGVRRQNLLRSLAQAISGLSVLQFSESGSLWFIDGSESGPVIDESWSLRVEGYVVKRDFEHVDPYSSTRTKLREDIDAFLDHEEFPANCRTVAMDNSENISMKGVLTLYQLMIEAFLDAAEVPMSNEKFVLMHSDYDIQNLLVDQDGNLTGVFDWDGVAAVPRQVGWCMLPFWLQQDWYPGYCWPPAIGASYAMLQPEDHDRYRQDFARYMWDACRGTGDCRFTSKSHIYRAILGSTSDRFNAYRFVQNVLADILPRRRGMAYYNQVGAYGFLEGEREWLQARLRNFFEPAAPRRLREDASSEDDFSGINDDAVAWVGVPNDTFV